MERTKARCWARRMVGHGARLTHSTEVLIETNCCNLPRRQLPFTQTSAVVFHSNDIDGTKV
jgi:hypothetical protein